MFKHRYLTAMAEGAEIKVVVKDAHGRYELEPVHVEVANVLGTASITAVRAFPAIGKEVALELNAIQRIFGYEFLARKQRGAFISHADTWRIFYYDINVAYPFHF